MESKAIVTALWLHEEGCRLFHHHHSIIPFHHHQAIPSIPSIQLGADGEKEKDAYF